MAKSKKRKTPLTNQKTFHFIVLPACIIAFCITLYSAIGIIRWKIDSEKTDEEISELQESVEVKEEDDSEAETTGSSTGTDDPYWKYITMNLIDVDFSELKKINSDVIGWLQVPSTNVNYPFVQTNDNEYYLKHAFGGSENSAGWVFLDYRNNGSLDDKNNIIYAHGRQDNTMFGSLRNMLQKTWYSNTDNHVIKVSTESYNSLWQIFSIYRIPTTNDYIKTSFSSDSNFENWLDMVAGRSEISFDTTASSDDRILTLSTCYDGSEKLVVHAKLIKYSEK